MLAETAICVTSSNDLAGIYLAGVRVPDGDVQMLASLVDEPTRSVLDNALKCGTVIVGLTIEDRVRAIKALEKSDAPALLELRTVLIDEHEWRTREGLV